MSARGDAASRDARTASGGAAPAVPRGPRRVAIRVALALVVLVALALTLRRIEWSAVLAALASARPGPLALAALLVVLPLGARSARAHALLRRVGHGGIPFGRVAAVTVFGFSMSSLTPGGSGDLLRVAALRPYGVAPGTAAALVVYERALDVVAMAALLGVALAIDGLAPAHAALAIGAGASALALAGVALVRARGAIDALGARLPAAARRLLPPAPVARVLLAPAVLARAFGATCVVFATEALRPWLVLEALGLDTGFLGAWAIFTLAWLAGLASLLPLGVGSWETAAVWAFAWYGVDASRGAAGAALLRAGVTLPAIVAGLLAMLVLRRAVGPRAHGDAAAPPDAAAPDAEPPRG